MKSWCCVPLGVVAGAVVALAIAVGVAWNAFVPSGAGPARADEAKPAADDCPMLGCSLSRNMVNTVEKDMPTDWSVEEGKQKNIKWVAKLGSETYGGPSIAGGKVYVGTNNDVPRDPAVTGAKAVLMCFNEADGKFLWQAVNEMTGERDAEKVGLCSTPAVEGNRIYYVAPAAEAVCADAATGKDVWRYSMKNELKVYPCFVANCSPLVAGDRLFLITGNGVEGYNDKVIPSPQAPSFLAMDRKSGKVAWQDNSPDGKIMQGQWSNPTYAEVNGKPQVIFGGGDGWLRAFHPQTGDLIWKFNCNPKPPAGADPKRARNYIIATPVVHDNKVYVGVGSEPSEATGGIGHLWCVDITKTGDLSPVNDNLDPKADVNKNSGLVWHFGGPTDAKTEEQTGRKAVFGRTLSACAVHDGLLYAADIDGYFYCLDANTGAKVWENDMKASIWGSPYWVDNKVYLGTEDGDVWVFAHGKEKKQLGKVEMNETIHSTPVAANGVLYVMTKQNLYAIKGK